MPALHPSSQDQLFASARTYAHFKPEAVSDALLKQLFTLAQWGPTAFNCQPARFVFVRSAEGKARLSGCLAPGNVAKVASAPVTVIVAIDSRFHEHLPALFPVNPNLGQTMAADPELAKVTGLRNGSLQGAYLILAARTLGLDCGPMSGFNAAALDQAFFPDGRWRSNFLINLGQGDGQALRPRGRRLAWSEAATLA
jgi:nitroreductase